MNKLKNMFGELAEQVYYGLDHNNQVVMNCDLTTLSLSEIRELSRHAEEAAFAANRLVRELEEIANAKCIRNI